MKYLRNLNNHNNYTAFIASTNFAEIQAEKNAVVSYCRAEDHVHYNPYVPPETRVVAKFNVDSTSSPTQIIGEGQDEEYPSFTAIEIDGVAQQSIVSTHTFSTTGEHTVKYTLADPTSIGNNAFRSCSSLTSIDIPNSVISIDSRTFYGCTGLTSVTIGSGVTSIGDYAFRSCTSLTSIDIPDSVTSIGEGAFSNCTGLTSIDIPDSVTSIGEGAFPNCTGLTSVTIGSGVRSIGDYAFQLCRSLTSIVCNAITAPTIGSSTFKNVKTGGTLTVSSGSSGYDVWMGTGNYYLGKYNWTKVEQ